MKIELQRPNLFSRTRRRTIADRFREVGVLSLCALLLVTPEMQAAKPGGVAVLLPPFVPLLPSTPFLFPESPFAMTGFIQSMTVDTPTDMLSGGTVTINGFTITVPRNTILQMPATQITWQELWSNAPAAYKALGQTGLALSDTPKPLSTFEFSVNGNRVINAAAGTDQYVAGLILISQQSLNASQGYINSIDYSRLPGGPAELLVSKTLGATTGARIRINTPHGRYGVPDPNADIRFTADEDNPTISARNGYPMCLPRINPATGTDSLCPSWNRPRDGFTGAFASNYKMSAATAGVPDAAGITHQVGYPASQAVKPDPFEQAPFEVGDYVTYIGTLTADPVLKAGTVATDPVNYYISAHTISADIAPQTAPGTWPVYTTIEDQRIFVGGVRNPIFPLEGQEKIFGDAFTTDYSQLVDIYAVDVDPCNGNRTHRFYMSSDPFGPPLGGLQGRARFRSTIGNFLPATREMAAVSRSMTQGNPVDSVNIRLTANGLAAGIFQAPQFEYIFPENLVIGSQQIPLTFETFPFLVNGSGPYVPFNSPAGTPPDPRTVGTPTPITPFPSTFQPPASCTVNASFFQPPTANAGSPQSVPSGSTVNLDGSLSTDPNVPAEPLIYTWIQSSGTSVPLLNANAAKPQFVAPIVPVGSTPVPMTFQLAVCNSFTCGGLSTVNVTVMAATGGPQMTLHADNSHPGPGQLVTMTSTTTGGVGAKTYKFTQTAGPAQVLALSSSVVGGVELDTAKFTTTLPAGTPLPATLTIQCTVTDAAGNKSTDAISVFGGSDTVTPTNTVYSLSKSRIQVAMGDTALPKGSAIITVTPMVNGVAIAAGIIATYDAGIDGYNILAAIVNPIPDSIKITSNYGFGLPPDIPRIFPITRIR
jgi:hypothetical protein